MTKCTTPETAEIHEVIRAQRVELVSADGRLLAVLSAEKWSDGGAVLSLCNANGQEMTTLTADNQTGRVSFSRAEDDASVWAMLDGKHGLYESPEIV